jgi:oligopeptide/dipeptide ABC transporter ATP-binding protein
MPHLLEVRDLSVHFDAGWRRAPLRAVDGVSFTVDAGETVGLVGESGSGKTTIGRAILGLTPVTAGTITFADADITRAGYRSRRSLSAELQAVFQNPYGSLNPTRTVGQTLAETLRPQRTPHAVAMARVREMLERVGLPAEATNRYPAHFSGGQRQRIAIARALMARPRLVICDEPTSALDLSVQASILNLLRELQRAFELSYLIITHDLAVVRHFSQRIIVLYQGRVMEEADAARICGQPIHPYTQALLASAPVPDPDEQRRRRALGHKPRDLDVDHLQGSDNCPFAPRCPYAIDVCRTSRPEVEKAPGSSLVACHRWKELASNRQTNQGEIRQQKRLDDPRPTEGEAGPTIPQSFRPSRP